MGRPWHRTIVQWLSAHKRLLIDILMEIAILVAVYFVYSFSRGSLGEKTVAACRHAREIMDLEGSLGIFVEADIQSFFLETPFRTDLVNVLYTICYYPALALFAVWAYWRHRRGYKFVRTAFVISAVLAFIVFALYPVAPPRFFDGNPDPVRCGEDLGFVDTIHDGWNVDETGTQAFYNPYAAMPSLHQGWTLMIGISVIWMTRRWAGWLVGTILPAVMFVGVVATANHFILDAVGGAVVIGLAFGLASLAMRGWNRLFSRGSSRCPPVRTP